MKRLIYIAPILVFAGLAFLLFRSLFAPPPDQLPSALIGKPAPALALRSLYPDTVPFGRSDLVAGHVTVLNVWASWCVPCRLEAPALKTLAQNRAVQVYGLVYKDDAEKARLFLAEVGNPFSRIDLDNDGRVAVDWGVYDVPETFVIDGHGIVRLRYSGALTPEVLSSTILPAIEAARASP